MSSKIAIIGAGPIGLETAVYATQLGYEVKVFEKGDIGANIREWGHVTFFSPWAMNHSPLGAQLLSQEQGWQQPDSNAMLTGHDFVENYLLPLSELPQLSNRIHTNTEVVSIAREQILKNSFTGNPRRSEFPFRILTSDSNGNEEVFRANIVIDSSGVYANPNWIGDGGIPAVGEKKYRDRIDYKLRDVSGRDRSRFAGKKTLLVGAGYSAATTICGFQKLLKDEPATSIIWAIREDGVLPIPSIENDPLPLRAEITAAANAVVENGGKQVQFRNRCSVDAIHFLDDRDKFEVALKQNGRAETIEVDRIIANVGYGPDNSIYRELQIHECYASRGPMNLAAALLGAASGDCLLQNGLGADTLKNPEPNFYIIGNKSYGRNSTFLIRVGLSQIVEVFSLISGDPKLDLYQNQKAAA
jgi:thioredoxin reductase